LEKRVSCALIDTTPSLFNFFSWFGTCNND
jgi:hypothetical protein